MRDIKPDRIPDPSGSGKKVEDFWGPSKRLLGDMKFLDSLKEYDKDNIPVGGVCVCACVRVCVCVCACVRVCVCVCVKCLSNNLFSLVQVHIMKKIRGEYTPNPEFDPVKVRTASSAAEGLCRWVQAMEIYDRVAKVSHTVFTSTDATTIAL